MKGSIIHNIPDEPKLQLDNYLLQLVTKEDTKRRSLYLNVTVVQFIKFVWEEILVNNPRKVFVRNVIPKYLGVRQQDFYNYKNGKKSISIDNLFKLLLLWKTLCGKSDSEFEQKWNLFFHSDFYFSTHSKFQKTFLPKEITPKLCYLVGWLIGDGCFQQKHYYVIKISEKNRLQLELVLRPLMKSLFGVDVPIFVGFGNNFRIQVGNKAIYRFLRNVLFVKVGQVPTWAWSLDDINKSCLLAGVFDSEGCVHRDRNRISIFQANIEFLHDVSGIFKSIGVNPNPPVFHKTQRGEWYTIDFGSKQEFLKFAHLVGSYHVDKPELINYWVNEIGESRNS